MRKKKERQLYLPFGLRSTRKEVKEYEEKYQRISAVLDETPEVLDLVHRDVKKLSTRNEDSGNRGRSGAYTSENILRAMVVHAIEQTDLRGTTVRIANSDCLKNFLRLGPRDVMTYSFLCKSLKCLSPKTVAAINDALAGKAVEDGSIDPSEARTDSTVVETNIHYPTDCSLLWDSARVLMRLLRRGRSIAPELCQHRFHDRKIKKLFVAINRASRSKAKGKKAKLSKRKIKKYYRKLIGHVQRLVDIAGPFGKYAIASPIIELRGVGLALDSLLPDVKKVIDQSLRAQLDGEKVPAKERIFSIFEPHTELIKRGKAQKPVEFGHKIVFTETRETFITDYDVLEENVNDSKLTETLLERHRDLFGEYPKVVAADTGFRADKETMERVEEKADLCAIPQKVADRVNEELAPWYRFRAGVEGTISVLKRAFRLFRCVYQGFKSFATHVGLGIFAHNLVLLARLRL